LKTFLFSIKFAYCEYSISSIIVAGLSIVLIQLKLTQTLITEVTFLFFSIAGWNIELIKTFKAASSHPAPIPNKIFAFETSPSESIFNSTITSPDTPALAAISGALINFEIESSDRTN